MGLAIIVPDVSFGGANLGKVTLSGNVPIRDLYINLEDSYIGTTVDLKCSYLPANTTQRDVVWSIENGSEYASITGSVLTILPGANKNNVTIKCTSVSNPSVYTTKAITVSSGDTIVLYDYMTTDGNSYFNIGKISVNDKITLVGRSLGLTNIQAGNAIFGVAKNNNTTYWIYALIGLYGSTPACSLCFTESKEINHVNLTPNSSDFNIVFDFPNNQVKFGSGQWSKTKNENAFINGKTANDCYVFAANRGDSVQSIMGQGLYKLKEIIVERSGVVVKHIVPATSGGVDGAYDTVNSVFLNNIGSGTFNYE